MVPSNQLAQTGADLIRDGFNAYQTRFAELTRRARRRFEARDWHGAQQDATERLALYEEHMAIVRVELGRALGVRITDVSLWSAIRERYAGLLAGRDDYDIGETFFNSVTRRVFATVGVDGRIEFLGLGLGIRDWGPGAGSLRDDPDTRAAGAALPRDDGTGKAEGRGPRAEGRVPSIRSGPIYHAIPAPRIDAALVREILASFKWETPFRNLDAAAERVAAAMRSGLDGAWDPERGAVVELLDGVFYRNKGAYVVGRVRCGDGDDERETVPLVLALLNTERGIVIDAVLMTADEASVVFGFSWTYFRVETRRPRAMVAFLHSIMPHKRVDELYTAIGYNKHGKTELWRGLFGHIAETDARFERAEGDEGLVMSVFALPSFNVVFKIIKDTFGQPKATTRRAVMEKYRLVFSRDRVGRLADAQEFGRLEFPARCFPEPLLAHLLATAAENVRVEGDTVVLVHCYTERRVTPLNLFLKRADPAAAWDAVVEYGNAIKDLAGANIFTGDMLPKNFGVSRHGRVIFYDYDELTLLTECHFRRLPPASDLQQEMAAEPWFYVGEHDVFPEEWAAFLVPPGELRDVFLASHADLLGVEFWREMQERQRAGEMPDVFPYRPERRLLWD